MSPAVLAFPGNEALAGALAATGMQACAIELRRFPDGESHVRVAGDVAGRDVVVVCNLDRADDKLLPLSFAISAARDLGARRVGVLAPYLGYMRQDARFSPGDAISALEFARLLSVTADFLVCVDPHLHRIKSLREIFSIPSAVVNAAPAMAEWIARNVRDAVILGPDEESEQWAAEVASLAGAPCDILRKVRKGDRDVQVSLKSPERWRGRRPVLLDDIISSGGTMMATVAMLRRAGLPAPVCIGVHAVFAPGAYEKLSACGAAGVITCNTLEHRSNAIDVRPLIARGVLDLLQKPLLL